MSQAFPDEIYGAGRGPSFQTRGGNRGASQDPFGGAVPMQAPTQAPPGGRELPSGYVIPPAPQAKPQSAPVNPSAGAREAANEQAAANMAAQADAAHKEAMAALKAAGQAKAAEQTKVTQQAAQSQAARTTPPSAAHAAAAAAAQVAAHAAPRQGPPPVPNMGPRLVPPLDPNKGPAVAPSVAPAAGVPLDQFYAQVAGNEQYGVVGGMHSGVSRGVTASAGQAKSSGVVPEEAWLIACKTTADGWLDMQPMQRLKCLIVAGSKPDVVGKVAAAVDAFAAKKTGRMQAAGMQPMGMQVSGNQPMGIQPVGMQQMRAAGQVIIAPAPDYTLPILLALGIAGFGTYLYVTGEKPFKKASSRRHSRRSGSYRLPAPRSGYSRVM